MRISGGRDRARGHVLVLVLVFSLILFLGLATCWYVVSSETQDTSSLVKELQALAIGEGAAARLVGLVNQNPWEERFYLVLARRAGTAGSLPGGRASFAFSHTSFPFSEDPQWARREGVEFYGLVRDLDPEKRRYRIYVEVDYYGHRSTLCWNKQYDLGLLSALNSDVTLVSKTLESEPLAGDGDADDILEAIVKQARDPSALDVPGLGGAGATVLHEFEKDLASMEQYAGMPTDLRALLAPSPAGSVAVRPANQPADAFSTWVDGVLADESRLLPQSPMPDAAAEIAEAVVDRLGRNRVQTGMPTGDSTTEGTAP